MVPEPCLAAAGRLLRCILGRRFQPWQAYRAQVREPIGDQLKLLHADESAEDAEEVLTLEGLPQVLVGQIQLLRRDRKPDPQNRHWTPWEPDPSTHLPDSFPSSPAVAPPSSVLRASSSSSPNRRLFPTLGPPSALLNDRMNELIHRRPLVPRPSKWFSRVTKCPQADPAAACVCV